MKATIVKSVVELVSVFNGEQEVSLLSYDGFSPFNRQGADLGNAQNDWAAASLERQFHE